MTRFVAFIATCVVVLAAVASASVATSLRGSRTSGTTPPPIIRIDGAAAGDAAGASVAGAGDLNGDGLADLLVGSSVASNNGRKASGSAYVLFGTRTPTNVNLAALGTRGFRIDGASDWDWAGEVAGAGDLNGDGLADVIVGAPDGHNLAVGSAYVVFGTRSPTNVDLAALSTRGFRIHGARRDDQAGYSVAGAGDVNGDGLADVIIGAPGTGDAGSAYVIFGTRSPTNVDLSALSTRGFRIDGAATAAGAGAGFSVAGAGDLNGDGLADVIVGAPSISNNGRDESGSAYVVFGTRTPKNVNLAAFGTRGFRIDGAAAGDQTGGSVAGAGDVNGDGLADLFVGADTASSNGRKNSGSAYVVFGTRTPTNVNLAALGTRGFRIDGAAAGDEVGFSVAGAGDLNGDGLVDLLAGAIQASNNGRDESGSAYVVFGTRTPTNVNLAALGTRGFRIDGAAAGDWTGGSVAGAGDVNGDGLADLLVAASLASNNGRKASGSAYVLFGKTNAASVDLGAANRETTPPKLILGGPQSQAALRQKSVNVSASCNEPCGLRAVGTVHLSSTKPILLLSGARATLRAAGKATLRLTLPAATRSGLTRALGRGERASATLTVRATDHSGNASTARRTIRLIR